MVESRPHFCLALFMLQHVPLVRIPMTIAISSLVNLIWSVADHLLGDVKRSRCDRTPCAKQYLHELIVVTGRIDLRSWPQPVKEAVA